MDHFQNPDPYQSGTHVPRVIHPSDFESYDYLMLEDGSEGDFSSQNMASPENVTVGSVGSIEIGSPTARASNINGANKKEIGAVSTRVAFRTKSEVEIMDDGFKWRKYGKKMVKSSPNPRYMVLNALLDILFL
ncbi:unnamed protein product [Ilex paraguariensis]|uniref:WRKY domain-containing protein n=1 Tax=Ilex paraguariensis TaxID=185542 RepID=A0ABC8RM49_9AQUA